MKIVETEQTIIERKAVLSFDEAFMLNWYIGDHLEQLYADGHIVDGLMKKYNSVYSNQVINDKQKSMTEDETKELLASAINYCKSYVDCEYFAQSAAERLKEEEDSYSVDKEFILSLKAEKKLLVRLSQEKIDVYEVEWCPQILKCR